MYTKRLIRSSKCRLFALTALLVLPQQSIAADNKDCFSRIKLALLGALVGSAELARATHRASQPVAPCQLALHQRLSSLAPVSLGETEQQKAMRAALERSIEGLIQDPACSDGPARRNDLHEKGYDVIQQKKLANRFTVQKERYPQAFKTFLARTNEKVLSHKVITEFIDALHKEHPEFTAQGLKVVDIGCGDGRFSESLITSFGKTLPRGTGNITFTGIDHQESFTQSTRDLVEQAGVRRPTTIVASFKDDAVIPQHLKKSANLVIASHFAYIFADMGNFITKVQDIMEPNGIAIFLHGGDTPIDVFRKKFADILRPAVTGNTPDNLHKAIKKAGLHFCSFAFNPTLSFPMISERDWKALRTVVTHDYDANYSSWSQNRVEAKRLIEFFLQDPLEAFTQQQRHRLVNEFRNMVVAHEFVLPLANTMQVITSREGNFALRQAVERAMVR